MSHSGLQPQPTENNGKTSLGFATNFSKLWETSLWPWPAWTWHGNLTSVGWAPGLTLPTSPHCCVLLWTGKSPRVWKPTGHCCTRHRHLCRLPLLCLATGKILPRVLLHSSAQHGLKQEAGLWMILYKSVCKRIYSMLSFWIPPIFFLYLAMLVSAILLFSFFPSDYNLQCKGTI